MAAGRRSMHTLALAGACDLHIGALPALRTLQVLRLLDGGGAELTAALRIAIIA
jgi:hypothetical protein